MNGTMDDRAPRRSPEPLVDLAVHHRWHLVGIGGPGMAPLAHLLRAAGQTVTGSDLRESGAVSTLRRAGIDVAIGHDESHVDHVDVVVYSTAVPDGNIEIAAARERGLRVCHRAVALGSVCAAARSVGVAGAHGKTTTTALVASMLRAAGIATAAYVGAEVLGDEPSSSMPAAIQPTTTIVVEADESDGTIEVLPFRAIAVTNVDVDHLDYWGDLDGIIEGFTDVVRRVVEAGDGLVVLNADDATSERLATELPAAAVRWFGKGERCDVRIVGWQSTPSGVQVALDVDGVHATCALPLRGAHNVANLACAVALATSCGADLASCISAAESFAGVERRFSERGSCLGALVVDDYAHLPAEIAAALAAARDHPRLSGRVVAVFQPNRFHRIAAMANDYAECFGDADMVVVTDIYASGTAPIEGVTGRLVADAVARVHSSVVWAPTRDDVVEAVRGYLRDGDICVGMGCGDISTLSADLGAEEP